MNIFHCFCKSLYNRTVREDTVGDHAERMESSIYMSRQDRCRFASREIWLQKPEHPWFYPCHIDTDDFVDSGIIRGIIVDIFASILGPYCPRLFWVPKFFPLKLQNFHPHFSQKKFHPKICYIAKLSPPPASPSPPIQPLSFTITSQYQVGATSLQTILTTSCLRDLFPVQQ